MRPRLVAAQRGGRKVRRQRRAVGQRRLERDRAVTHLVRDAAAHPRPLAPAGEGGGPAFASGVAREVWQSAALPAWLDGLGMVISVGFLLVIAATNFAHALRPASAAPRPVGPVTAMLLRLTGRNLET